MPHDHTHSHDHHDAPEHGPSHGVHGMLVLGSRRLAGGGRSPVYLSHLPMFMLPHDLQVILRVGGDAAGAHARAVAHFGEDEIYTFVPEAFATDDLDDARGPAALTSFRGALFRGHFERGGSEIASDVTVEVQQVVHFHHFGPKGEAPRPDELRYLCFGQRDAAFMAHVITAPPDFDQLLTADVGASVATDEQLQAGVIVTIPGRRNDVEDRLRAGQSIATALLDLTATSEYYLETGDLAAVM